MQNFDIEKKLMLIIAVLHEEFLKPQSQREKLLLSGYKSCNKGALDRRSRQHNCLS